MTDNTIEQEIQAKGLTAADVEANIASEHYFTGTDGIIGVTAGRAIRGESLAGMPPPPALGLLTFCVLVLQNGFTVTGKAACASPDTFDAAIGRKIARSDAVLKAWSFMGRQLKQELHLADKKDIA
jgi:hypothetical protein